MLLVWGRDTPRVETVGEHHRGEVGEWEDGGAFVGAEAENPWLLVGAFAASGVGLRCGDEVEDELAGRRGGRGRGAVCVLSKSTVRSPGPPRSTLMPVGSLAVVLDTIDSAAVPPQACGAVGHGGAVLLASAVGGQTGTVLGVVAGWTPVEGCVDRGHSRIAIKVATARAARSSAAIRIRRGRRGGPGSSNSSSSLT